MTSLCLGFLICEVGPDPTEQCRPSPQATWAPIRRKKVRHSRIPANSPGPCPAAFSAAPGWSQLHKLELSPAWLKVLKWLQITFVTESV